MRYWSRHQYIGAGGIIFVAEMPEWDLSKFVDKKYAHLPPSEILKLPVDAIRGISKRDAELLREALGVKTVGDLTVNKYVVVAQAITALAPWWEEALDKEWEDKSPREVAEAPVEALAGISPRRAQLLYEALGIKKVRDLATNRLIAFAQIIRALAALEEIARSKEEFDRSAASGGGE